MGKPFVFRIGSELSQKHLKHDDRQVVGSNELESGYEAFGFQRSIRNLSIEEKSLVCPLKDLQLQKSRKQ